MGLFVQRPEEPTEWAGLPGEPLRARTPAELLPDAPESSASPAALLDMGAVATTSIAIDVPPVATGAGSEGDAAETADDDAS